MICAQTRLRGVSVSQVARRYDVNANQVFNWLKEPRFVAGEPPEAEVSFLPVEINQARDMTVMSDSPEATGTLEIDLANGHRLRITGPYDGDALARLIRGLSA
jgi:transposase